MRFAPAGVPPLPSRAPGPPASPLPLRLARRLPRQTPRAQSLPPGRKRAFHGRTARGPGGAGAQRRRHGRWGVSVGILRARVMPCGETRDDAG